MNVIAFRLNPVEHHPDAVALADVPFVERVHSELVTLAEQKLIR